PYHTPAGIASTIPKQFRAGIAPRTAVWPWPVLLWSAGRQLPSVPTGPPITGNAVRFGSPSRSRLKVALILDSPDKPFYRIDAASDRHFGQRGLNILEVTAALGGSFIQNGDGTGVSLQADGSSEPLLKSDLHLRHSHGPDERAEIRICLSLFFLQGVRILER